MKSMRWYVSNGNSVSVISVLFVMSYRMLRWKMILSVAIWLLMRWFRTITARLSIRITVWAICKIVCCVMFFSFLAKIRYAYCAWRVLLRVMFISVFVLSMKFWRWCARWFMRVNWNIWRLNGYGKRRKAFLLFVIYRCFFRYCAIAAYCAFYFRKLTYCLAFRFLLSGIRKSIRVFIF